MSLAQPSRQHVGDPADIGRRRRLEDRLFKRPFPCPTAPRAPQYRCGTQRPNCLEPVFGCRRRSVRFHLFTAAVSRLAPGSGSCRPWAQLGSSVPSARSRLVATGRIPLANVGGHRKLTMGCGAVGWQPTQEADLAAPRAGHSLRSETLKPCPNLREPASKLVHSAKWSARRCSVWCMTHPTAGC